VPLRVQVQVAQPDEPQAVNGWLSYQDFMKLYLLLCGLLCVTGSAGGKSKFVIEDETWVERILAYLWLPFDDMPLYGRQKTPSTKLDSRSCGIQRLMS